MEKMTTHTKDVISEKTKNATFQDLAIPNKIQNALEELGFHRPSPIQLLAIPPARMGSDLIIQAKSGTGKTCVFAVTAVDLVMSYLNEQNVKNNVNNNVNNNNNMDGPLVLIIAPTREIAWQASEVVESIGSNIHDLNTRTCVGGIHVKQDVDALNDEKHIVQIVIGTPGRIKHLIVSGALRLNDIQLFILDEADKLMNGEFYKDIYNITTYLPTQRQTLVLSATFTANVVKRLGNIMLHPQFIKINNDKIEDNKDHNNDNKSITSSSPIITKHNKNNVTKSQFHSSALIGVTQYYCCLTPNNNNDSKKNNNNNNNATNKQHRGNSSSSSSSSFSKLQLKRDKMIEIISANSFNQCIIFCNLISEILSLVKSLNQRGWKTAYLCSHQTQHERFANIKLFKEKDVRILITTDLVARGIDVPSVTLVINMEIPFDPETYVHRVGRTGRFGTIGYSVTLVSKEEINAVKALEDIYNMKMVEMKDDHLCVVGDGDDNNTMTTRTTPTTISSRDDNNNINTGSMIMKKKKKTKINNTININKKKNTMIRIKNEMKRSDKVVIQSKDVEKKKVVVSSIQQLEAEAEAEAVVNGLSLYDQWVHEYL